MLINANIKFSYGARQETCPGPAKKLVQDPPRNLSRTRQETCPGPAKKLVQDPPRNLLVKIL